MALEGITGRLARSKHALGALRHPEYRKYWFSTFATVTGFQTTMFSQLWLVRQLEEDPIWLGAVGLSMGVPGVAFTLFGGIAADKFDRRLLLVVTQAISGALIFVMAALTLLGIVNVWHVLVVAFCIGATRAFDQPCRFAIFPLLIDKEEMMNAVALNSAIWQTNRILAPALAGVVIAIADTEAALFLGSVGFLVTILPISRLRLPPIKKAVEGSPIQNLLGGARFIRGNSLFSSLIALTFFDGFFGLTYIYLMPTFIVDIFQRDASAQGLLLSISGVGAILGITTAALMGRFHHRGWLILGGSALFGFFVLGFGLSSWYYFSIAVLFLASFCQSVYMVSIQSTLQIRVPEELRGRVMGIYAMTYNLSPIGGMMGGVVASLISARFAVAMGGSAVAAFSFLNGALNRQIRHLASEQEPAHSSRSPGGA